MQQIWFSAVENDMVIELKSTAGSETSLALKTLKWYGLEKTVKTRYWWGKNEKD